MDDLLKLAAPSVMRSLLAGVAAAAIGRFASGTPPFALWLVGPTGAGKSFPAKLCMNFFGSFSTHGDCGNVASWTSTANYLQREGYFFKDALYLVDDYKPETAESWKVLHILQNYADRAARGRLKSDATTNVSRPIRGLLLCTGEDFVEHSSSSFARSIVVRVQQEKKDLDRAQRCRNECQSYRTIMADFLRWFLVEQRSAAFAQRVEDLTNFYYRGIAGQQNDSRIARNFALLAAAFEEFARYFQDAWEGWQSEAKEFVEVALVELRDEMVGSVVEQQPSRVFWSILGDLHEHGQVTFDTSSQREGRGAVVGKRHYPGTSKGKAGTTLFAISSDLALAEVNKCLHSQGKPLLKVSHKVLIEQLRRDGVVLNEDGRVLSSSGKATKQVRVSGNRHQAFITSEALLRGSDQAGCQSEFDA